MNTNWKKIIGVSLSVFALFVSSVGLTGCETEEEEIETEELEIEEE